MKLGLKCFPDQLENRDQAVLQTVNQYILPLLKKKKKDLRSTQNPLLAKLIYLVNTPAVVSFMSILFQVLAGEVYQVYADRKSMIKFDNFLEFAKDHDIFPKLVPKAAINTVFQSLAILNETLRVQSSPSKSKIDRLSVSPHRGDCVIQQGTLDRNLFIEAVTLCALFHTPHDKAFSDMIKMYNGGDISSNLEHATITKCLNLVANINNSDSTSSCLSRPTAGSNIKFNLQDRGKDFMHPFKECGEYAWYF